MRLLQVFILSLYLLTYANAVTINDCYDLRVTWKNWTFDKFMEKAMEILSKSKAFNTRAREMLNEASDKRDMAKAFACAIAVVDNKTGDFKLDVTNEGANQIYVVGHNLNSCDWVTLTLSNEMNNLVWKDNKLNKCFYLRIKPDTTFADHNVYIRDNTLHGHLVGRNGAKSTRYYIAKGIQVNMSACTADPSAWGTMFELIESDPKLYERPQYTTSQYKADNHNKIVSNYNGCGIFHKNGNAWYSYKQVD